MRKYLTIALVLLTTGAQAATVPLAAVYSSPEGCEAHAGGAAASGGKATLISSDDVRFEGNVCPYTGVTEAEEADGSKGWQVKIACESGHEEVVRGTLAFTEAPDATSLSVELLDGAGPEGKFTACEAKAQ